MRCLAPARFTHTRGTTHPKEAVTVLLRQSLVCQVPAEYGGWHAPPLTDEHEQPGPPPPESGGAPRGRGVGGSAPAASQVFCWQFVFPAATLCLDPRTGRRLRRHLHESAAS